eukprot:537507-Karenia_brevis.AAC.1
MQSPGLERERSAATHLDPVSSAAAGQCLLDDLCKKDILQELWPRQCALPEKVRQVRLCKQ